MKTGKSIGTNGKYGTKQMKDKEIYIHVRQTNSRTCWINPRHVIRINKQDDVIELLLTNSQIVDLNEHDSDNEEMMKYLNLNRKKVL